MTTQHAPGPWVIDGSVNAENLDVINSEGRIAMIDDSRSTGWNVPTINANARLISAAPTMLEALQALVARCKYDGIPNDSQRVVDAAESAIAAATGGKS